MLVLQEFVIETRTYPQPLVLSILCFSFPNFLTSVNLKINTDGRDFEHRPWLFSRRLYWISELPGANSTLFCASLAQCFMQLLSLEHLLSTQSFASFLIQNVRYQFLFIFQDFEVFRSIDPREYIYKLWNFGPKLTENLRKFSEVTTFAFQFQSNFSNSISCSFSSWNLKVPNNNLNFTTDACYPQFSTISAGWNRLISQTDELAFPTRICR